MPKLQDICRHVRTKNAGPFWITLDLFFKDRDAFDRYAEAKELQIASIARVFGIDESTVRRFRVPDLHVIKISYPRTHPQGGVLERDMHGGQQYARLLPVEIE